jgi:enamine deaminase RidA (YjgF/YER057c/UK114 family)
MIQRTNVEGLSEPPGYSHAVVASGGRLVTMAGAVPLDPEGNLVGPGDCAAQTKQVLKNLALALGAVGAQGSDVLKTTVYVASENREDLVAVWQVVQGSEVADAASTLLGVSLLGYEGQLVEIEATAVLE